MRNRSRACFARSTSALKLPYSPLRLIVESVSGRRCSRMRSRRSLGADRKECMALYMEPAVDSSISCSMAQRVPSGLFSNTLLSV